MREEGLVTSKQQRRRLAEKNGRMTKKKKAKDVSPSEPREGRKKEEEQQLYLCPWLMREIAVGVGTHTSSSEGGREGEKLSFYSLS